MRIDLHRHLEGSHSPQALAQVAEQFQIRDPLFFDAKTQRFRSAAELSSSLTMAAPTDDAMVFYECIKKARAAYVSEAAIESLSYLGFSQAAAETDGFEMRVSLFSMTRTLFENERGGWRDVEPVVFAQRCASILSKIISARDRARRETKKAMLIRLGFSRTFESEPHYRAMADAVREQASALCGLDVLGIVSGADKEPMPVALRTILEQLRAVLPDLTVHAGEFEGAPSVERTLELAPQAIGHGVHSVQSAQTMERLAKDGVTVEVCPTSNRMLIPTALSKLQQAHRGSTPLVVLQNASVHCVLGSDDPTPLGSSFEDEWRNAERLGVDMRRLAADTGRRWKQLAQ